MVIEIVDAFERQPPVRRVYLSDRGEEQEAPVKPKSGRLAPLSEAGALTIRDLDVQEHVLFVTRINAQLGRTAPKEGDPDVKDLATRLKQGDLDYAGVVAALDKLLQADQQPKTSSRQGPGLCCICFEKPASFGCVHDKKSTSACVLLALSA
eukprot:CAMPEP_0204358434 /NCGR_PEP_ID=MMETSP0469-20131031/36513_1 /ASSEMBLY_ACC=CAM_ASM_000384 /TAXON_ID=2969 /ORGANISM="Oxyrrhis marina" /LENGTH=151 /DNA_ID=CAMNT_0051346299 /DNA_START=51 /DNA_END=507 /DNA_ORIENTATION=+